MGNLYLTVLSVVIGAPFIIGALYLSWFIFRKRLIENESFIDFCLDNFIVSGLVIRKDVKGFNEEVKVIFLEILFRLFGILLICLAIAITLFIVYYVNKLFLQ